MADPKTAVKPEADAVKPEGLTVAAVIADALAPDAAAAPEVLSKTIEVFSMQAVYGPLNHPYTHHWFDTFATDHVMDDWCKSQIDGGKLVIVPAVKAE